jgi:zinc/manganese transport system permease protein
MFGQLLGQHFVHTALLAGAVVSIVCGAIGSFVVMRGLSFAVHAISELGFTGAAGALVLGLDPVIGMISGSLLVGLVLGLLSLRGSERDSSIGAVLAFGLGVGVLLLSLYQGYATEATNLLFGSIVGVDDAQLRALILVAAIVLAGLIAIYRPLLFESVDPEVAEARGVPVRAISVAIFLLLALTTAEAIQVVGVLLVLTLVITPAAAAQRLTARPGLAIGISIAIALVSTEGGILLSLAQPWPTSFFISAISFGIYLVARISRHLSAPGAAFSARAPARREASAPADAARAARRAPSSPAPQRSGRSTPRASQRSAPRPPRY